MCYSQKVRNGAVTPVKKLENTIHLMDNYTAEDISTVDKKKNEKYRELHEKVREGEAQRDILLALGYNSLG